MPSTRYVGPLQDPYPGASYAAIASTTTETNVVGTVSGTCAQVAAIPTQSLRAGAVFVARFGGKISTTGTPTVIWTPRWGQSDTATSNVTLGASPTITTVTGLSNHVVDGWFRVVVRDVGIGSGAVTAVGSGQVAWGNATAGATVATLGGTVMTTGSASAPGLMISLTWGTNSASNTFTCNYFYVESAD